MDEEKAIRRFLGERPDAEQLRVWRKTLEDRQYPGAAGTFVHPFDDNNFIAGHGTIGLEILEDAPDTRAIWSIRATAPAPVFHPRPRPPRSHPIARNPYDPLVTSMEESLIVELRIADSVLGLRN